MKKFLSVLLGIASAIAITLIVSSCAVKPKYLVEGTLKEKAQKEINTRQQEWNWKNRHRVRQEREFWEERFDILPPMGNVKMQRIRRMRQYRNPQLGIGRNTYNPNKSGQRRHIIPKKYNGVAVHRKNYWSKTTKDPKTDE
jgi:hypothetical protein